MPDRAQARRVPVAVPLVSSGGRSRATSLRRIRFAHDSDRVAVWVSHDSVAGSPERVVRVLLHFVARGDQPSKEFVDSGALDDTEPDHRPVCAGGPTVIPLLRERLAVKVDVEAVARHRLAMMFLPAGIEISDV